MKKILIVLTLAVAFAFTATSAHAIIPAETTTSHNVYNAINRVLGLNPGDTGYYNSNVEINGLQVTSGDEYWSDLSTSISDQGPYIALGVSAGNINDLDVYQKNGTATSSVFTGHTGSSGVWFGDGTAADPYTEFAYSYLPAGVDFGWELTSTDPLGSKPTLTWDSVVANNGDGYDHMLTYDLTALLKDKTVCIESDGTTCTKSYTFKAPYLVAWEDLPDVWGSDIDYDHNDMMYIIDNVMPNVIPEPMSMLLLGTGLFGLVGLRKKRS